MKPAVSPYKLPELPYAFDALEPHISARIMELHHGKHHAAYVEGANKALEQIAAARAKDELTSIAALERTLAFNLSGHVLHSLFWTCLAPDGGGRPGRELATAIDRDFGSFDAFKHQLTQAAATVMGSGWAAMVWEPVGRRLLVTQIEDHQSNVVEGGVPVMVLDAWEHAYYLQYENRKAEYFDAIWNVWNWSAIAKRLERVSSPTSVSSSNGHRPSSARRSAP
jgi:Fe-Mn family superoxide dismutase